MGLEQMAACLPLLLLRVGRWTFPRHAEMWEPAIQLRIDRLIAFHALPPLLAQRTAASSFCKCNSELLMLERVAIEGATWKQEARNELNGDEMDPGSRSRRVLEWDKMLKGWVGREDAKDMRRERENGTGMEWYKTQWNEREKNGKRTRKETKAKQNKA